MGDMLMVPRTTLAVACLAVIVTSLHEQTLLAADSDRLTLVLTIQLEGKEGRLDHMALD